MLRAQVRVGPAGFIGLDAPACLALAAAHGLPTDITAFFLPWWEAGLAEAFAEQREDRS